MKKLRYREVKQLARGHTASNADRVNLASMLLMTMLYFIALQSYLSTLLP